MEKSLACNEKKKYFVMYTIVFSLFAVAIFFPFIRERVWLISSKDTIKQHYPAFVYLGQYVREIVRTLFETGKLVVPQWDWNLAYGSSIFTTLNYYSFGDPLNIISVFVPTKYSPYAFQAVSILRLYLSGITFSMYCWNKQKDKFPILAGAVMYIFSAYGLQTSTGHVFFTNALIYLPVFLMAVERLIYKKKGRLLTLITFISCVSNFYFLYMLSIFAGVYFLILFKKRYFSDDKKNVFKRFVQEGFRFLFSYLGGLGCAAVIFLPVLIAVKNSGRSSGGVLNLFTYHTGTYVRLFTGSFGPMNLGGGFAALLLLAIVAMILKKGKYRGLLAGLVIIVVMQFIPAVGWVLNGFSYVTDRWVFILSFYASYIVVQGIPEIYCLLERKSLIKGFVILSVYLGALLGLRRKYNWIEYDIVYTIIFTALTLLVFWVWKSRRWKYIEVVVLGLLLVNICCISAPEFNNVIQSGGFTTKKDLEKMLSDSSLPESYEMAPGEKIDVLGSNIMNFSIFNHYASATSYWSMGSKGVSDYSNLLLNQKMAVTNAICGYDSRTVLNSLNSVKYIIVNDSYYERIPYGYELVEEKYNKKKELKKRIYKNKYYLAPAYTYDCYLSKDEWLQLSPTEREESMLDAAILEEAKPQLRQVTNLKSAKQCVQTGDSFIEAMGEANKENADVVIEDNSITVKKDGISIKVPVTLQEKSENYVYFKNLTYEPLENEIEIDETPMRFVYAGIGNYCNFANQYSRYHPDREDFLASLGYSETGGDELLIYFYKRGTYQFDKMEFISKTMDCYKEKIVKLRKNNAENIKVEGNYLTLEKTSKKQELLYINIPYSSGWKAFVNGKETEVKCANVMGMGVILPKGDNQIVMKYTTPGLKEGSIISLMTLLIIFLLRFRKKRTDKLGQKKGIETIE